MQNRLEMIDISNNSNPFSGRGDYISFDVVSSWRESATMMFSTTTMDWTSVHYLAFVACGLVCSYWMKRFIRRRIQSGTKSVRNSQRESSTPPWPVVPGARPLLGNPIPGGVFNSFAMFEKWASEYGESGMFECNVMGQKLIILCSDETIATLEEHRPYDVIRRSKMSRALRSTGIDGIFSAEGDRWKRDRRLVGPALNLKNVKDYLAAAKLVAYRLVTKWENTMARDGVVDVNADLLCYAIDIVGLVVFATDIDSIRSGDKGICQDISNILKRIMFRIFAPFPYWKIPIVGQYIDGCGWYSRRAKNILRDIVSRDDKKNQKMLRRSVMGKIMALSDRMGIPLSEDQMYGNLFTLFSAGSETSYNTMLVCLYELALDKVAGGTLQDEIAAEVKELFAGCCSSDEESGGDDDDDDIDLYPDDGTSAIDLDRLNEGLPRMRSLVYETLRVKGPSPMINGESKTDLMINGNKVPAGSQFLCLARYASMQESQWSVANKRTIPRGPRNAPPDAFCPRRWLVSTGAEPPENDSSSSSGTTTTSATATAAQSPSRATNSGASPTTHKNAPLRVVKPSHKNGYRPFGSSARVCPGRSMAEMEILVMLSFLLRKYEITLDGGKAHVPMEFTMRVTYTPTTDVRLVLKPRR